LRTAANPDDRLKPVATAIAGCPASAGCRAFVRQPQLEEQGVAPDPVELGDPLAAADDPEPDPCS